MEHIGAGYENGEGLLYFGRTHIPGGFCMLICGVCKDGKIDRFLSEYVWRRLKYWALRHKVTGDSREELEGLMNQVQEELEVHGQIRKKQGDREEIQWTHLTLLVCTGDLALVAARGQGRIMVCQKSMGRCVWEPLLLKKGNTLLVRLRPRIGVLLLENGEDFASCWQQALDPEVCRNEIQLKHSLEKLKQNLSGEFGSLAYMIYMGE